MQQALTAFPPYSALWQPSFAAVPYGRPALFCLLAAVSCSSSLRPPRLILPYASRFLRQTLTAFPPNSALEADIFQLFCRILALGTASFQLFCRIPALGAASFQLSCQVFRLGSVPNISSLLRIHAAHRLH